MSAAQDRPDAHGHWTVVRRRVSVAGRVARADGAPVASGIVRLRHEDAAKPQAGSRRAPAKSIVDTVVHETAIRRDGSYFYLDLPAGRYVAGGHDERGRSIEAKAIDVPVADRARLPPLLDVELKIEEQADLHASKPP